MEMSLKRRRCVEDDEDERDTESGSIASSKEDEPIVKVQRGSGDLVVEGNGAAKDEAIAARKDRESFEGEGKSTEALKDADVDAPGRCSSSYVSNVVVDSLTEELLVQIFSYLSLKDLLRSVGRVCRQWRRASLAPELWRHIVLDVNKLGLRQGMDYRPKLITDEILKQLTSLSRGIVTVDLTDCNGLSTDAVSHMTFRCRNLRSLNLTRSILQIDRILLELSVNCKQLESLVLDNCTVYSDHGIEDLVRGCRQLRKLSLANNFVISDGALKHIAAFAPQLQYLSIDRRQIANSGHPDRITDVGLSSLAEGCPNLEQLNICGLTGVTAQGLRHLSRLRGLRGLDMARINSTSPSEDETRAVTEAVLAVVDANSLTLNSLNVSIVKRIDDEFVERLAKKAKVLQQLFILDSSDLSDKGLEALADHCLKLSKLDVSWCRKLTDEGVKYLVTRRPSLTLLGLVRCDNVTDACVDQLMEIHPSVEFQTFTLGCRQILMRASDEENTT